MSKVRTVMALFLLALAIMMTACGGAAPTPKPAATAVASGSVVKAASRIVAEGKVVPARNASLSFRSGGIIKEVAIAQGDKVEAGKVLAQLETKELELQLAQADANLASAQAKLALLKRGPLPENVTAAQQNLTSAQAVYDALTKPSPTDIAALKADLDKTQALLNQATAAYDAVGGDGNPESGRLPQRAQMQTAWIDFQKAQTMFTAKMNPTNAQLQQALAAIQTAKDQLVKLQPVAEDVAGAQANVNAAQAGRDLIAEQIKNARLVAPFAGTVTTLDLRAGEYATPGTPVLRLADTSNFQVETSDLTELNVVNIKEGDPVGITLDAIPDADLSGKVAKIKGFGENRQGDIVYTVTVELDNQDPRLRWNMTAKVSIEPRK